MGFSTGFGTAFGAFSKMTSAYQDSYFDQVEKERENKRANDKIKQDKIDKENALVRQNQQQAFTAASSTQTAIANIDKKIADNQSSSSKNTQEQRLAIHNKLIKQKNNIINLGQKRLATLGITSEQLGVDLSSGAGTQLKSIEHEGKLYGISVEDEEIIRSSNGRLRLNGNKIETRVQEWSPTQGKMIDKQDENGEFTYEPTNQELPSLDAMFAMPTSETGEGSTTIERQYAIWSRRPENAGKPFEYYKNNVYDQKSAEAGSIADENYKSYVKESLAKGESPMSKAMYDAKERTRGTIEAYSEVNDVVTKSLNRSLGKGVDMKNLTPEQKKKANNIFNALARNKNVSLIEKNDQAKLQSFESFSNITESLTANKFEDVSGFADNILSSLKTFTGLGENIEETGAVKSLMTKLSYSMARAMNGSGVLSTTDVALAADAIGSLSSSDKAVVGKLRANLLLNIKDAKSIRDNATTNQDYFDARYDKSIRQMEMLADSLKSASSFKSTTGGKFIKQSPTGKYDWKKHLPNGGN